MSDIAYSISAAVDKGVFRTQFSASNTATMSTTGVLAVTLRCGTATQAISTASASSLGYCFARNLAEDTSGTAVVSFGKISGTNFFDAVRLKPGDASFLRLAPGNYAARGVAGSPTLLVEILED
jgi:hypothetical protein